MILARPSANAKFSFLLKSFLAAAACLAATATHAQSVDVLKASGFELVACTPAFPEASVVAWTDFFYAWPGYGDTERLFVPYNGFIALSFTATQLATAFGSVTTADFPGDGDGIGQMSISRTPGCFDQAHLGENCLSPAGRFASIGWMNRTGPWACNLTPGENYYVNITYGAGPAPTGAQCPSGICGADVIQYVQD